MTAGSERDGGRQTKDLDRIAKAEEQRARAEEREANAEEKSSKSKKEPLLRRKWAADDPSRLSTLTWLAATIFILGLIQYFIRTGSDGPSAWAFSISLILFVLGIIAVCLKQEEKRYAVLLPVLFFVLWYFVYDSNTDSTFLFIFLTVFVVISAGFAYANKGQTFAPELSGFMPVLFFFLDIGLLALLTEKIGFTLTPLLSNLILFMPWWALFGLFTIPAGVIRVGWLNSLFGIAKLLAILYIIFVLVTPAIPGIGHDDTSLLPEQFEFEAAQTRLRQASSKPENPVWSNVLCMFQAAGGDVNGCVAQRQESSEIENFCEEQINLGNADNQQVCEEEQKRIRIEETEAARGSVATNFEKVTKATFKLDTETDAFSSVFSTTGVLVVENPREQALTIQAGCELKRGTQTIATGVINVNGRGVEPVSFKDELREIPMTCTFNPKPAAGRYDVEFSATISGLQTSSWVKRTFFATDEELKRYKNQVLADQYPQATDRLSQAPAEFARLNVEFGTSRENPLIVVDQPVLAWVSLENAGRGRVTYAHNYELTTLREDGFSVKEGDQSCLEGGSLEFSEAFTKKLPSKILFAKRCFLNVPAGFADVSGDGKTKTFLANVMYNYAITEKTSVEIAELPSLEGESASQEAVS